MALAGPATSRSPASFCSPKRQGRRFCAFTSSRVEPGFSAKVGIGRRFPTLSPAPRFLSRHHWWWATEPVKRSRRKSSVKFRRHLMGWSGSLKRGGINQKQAEQWQRANDEANKLKKHVRVLFIVYKTF